MSGLVVHILFGWSLLSLCRGYAQRHLRPLGSGPDLVTVNDLHLRLVVCPAAPDWFHLCSPTVKSFSVLFFFTHVMQLCELHFILKEDFILT